MTWAKEVGCMAPAQHHPVRAPRAPTAIAAFRSDCCRCRGAEDAT